MSPREFVLNLFSKKLISTEQLSSLRQMAETDASVQLLTEILPRKGPQAYEKFLSVLEETEGQEFLVEQFDLRREGAWISVLQPISSNYSCILCDAVSSNSDESATSGDSGNSLHSTVQNLQNENTMLEERVVALESDQVKARSMLKQNKLLEMGLRLRGCDDVDMITDEFEVKCCIDLICLIYAWFAVTAWRSVVLKPLSNSILLTLSIQTSKVRPSWMKVAELTGSYCKEEWAPPLPPNKLPFTVIQGKAIVAENKNRKLVVVDLVSQAQSSQRLPEFLGLICALERCQGKCYAVTSQGRRLGIHEYDVGLNKWGFIDDMPGGHVFLTVSVTTYGKHMYFVSSMEVQEGCSIVLSFNTESRQWKRLPDLQSSVLCPSLVISNNRLLVAGCVSPRERSRDEDEYSARLQRNVYSLLLSSQEWIDAGSTKEWNPRLNVCHNLVVATGGVRESVSSIAYRPKPKHKLTEELSMRILDPRTKQWLPLPPLPVASSSVAQHSTCVTEEQTLLVLTQTCDDDKCLLYQMDVPCEMSADSM